MEYERIKIKNFGPLKVGTSGLIPIKKTTVFIGEQGSGKSTIVKVFSSLNWLEKFMVRNESSKFSFKDLEAVFSQQNIPSNYFNDKTQIVYQGLYYQFEIEKNKFSCKKLYPLFDLYYCPKIIYIPSERNIISVINNLYSVDKLPEMLRQLLYLQDEAKKSVVEFAFNSFNVKFDSNKNEIYVYSNKSTNSIRLSSASSGLQSITPIVYVLMYLRNELNQSILKRIKNLNETHRSKLLMQINDSLIVGKLNEYFNSNLDKNFSNNDIESIEAKSRHFVNNRLVSIIEEPEQNLFPVSQIELLKKVLSFSSNDNDKIILTTHSPYILSEINNLIFANDVYKNCKKTIKSISKQIVIDANKVSAYRIKSGKVYSIFDKENNIIDVSEIDDCSININNEYDALIDLKRYEKSI